MIHFFYIILLVAIAGYAMHLGYVFGEVDTKRRMRHA